MKHIYTITTFIIPEYKLYDTDVYIQQCSSRTIGWYNNCDDAVKSALFNDIWENGYYNVVLIERISEGVYTCEINNQLWFNNNGEIIDVPDYYKNMCSISMG